MNASNQKTTELLSKIVADQFVIYAKARNFHWNVKGKYFFGLHAAFENIYDKLADDIDAVAERIRTLGYNAPGTLKEFLELSEINETPGVYPEAKDMVSEIVNDLKTLIKNINESAAEIQKSSDEVTAGALYALNENYEKTVWMLETTLN